MPVKSNTANAIRGGTRVEISQTSTPSSGNILTATGANGASWQGAMPAGAIVGTSDTQDLTNKTLTSPTLGGTISGQFVTNFQAYEFNGGGSGNRYCYLDLHGDDTYTDYGLRIIRHNTGANATSELSHRGSGNLALTCVEGATVYISNACSALSYTDRTPHYEGDAIGEIKKIKGKSGKIDHSTLPPFVLKRVKKNDGTLEDGRDLGAMISVLTVAVQQLVDRIENLEKQVKLKS